MVKDTDLLQAVKDNDLDGVDRLLFKAKGGVAKLLSGSKKQLNINYQDEEGMSALHQASLQGNVECMLLLLKGQATADLKDTKGMQPLHYAAWQGQLNPVSLLLQWNAPANERCNKGETPLHFACKHGHLDVISKLLSFKGDPTILNSSKKTPLHLACEFGNLEATRLLLKSGRCDSVVKEKADICDKSTTTCLHLAAKNGHASIIRLLLKSGVSINRQTDQGTALHESAQHGRLEASQVLIESGIDISVPNSYDQTALDVVNKRAKGSGSAELKGLLKEASQVIYAKVLKDFEADAEDKLALRAGDYITVIERKPGGLWKGFIQQNGRMARSGFFPSSCVTIVEKSVYEASMSQANGQLTPQPTTPSSAGAFFSSNFIPPPSPYRQDLWSSGSAPGFFGPPSPALRGPEMAAIPEHRAASHMVGSPSTSSRNSIGSLDSRSGYRAAAQAHRLSGNSCESSVFSSRQSCHSNSTSSLTSIDREEMPLLPPTTTDIRALYERGYSEAQIIHQWLAGFKYEIYVDNFINAGYDMPTISRMTPGDLTAIGINKPNHRKHLKSEIARLSIHDGIPEHQPNSLQEWLHVLRLDEYQNALSGDYSSVASIVHIGFEDLESLGIKRLGHQKKLLLAVEKLKKVLKRQSSASSTGSGSVSSAQFVGAQASSLPNHATGSRCWSADVTAAYEGEPGASMGTSRPYKSLSGDQLHHHRSMGRSMAASAMATNGSREESPSGFGPLHMPPVRGHSVGEYGPTAGLVRSNSHSVSSGRGAPDVVPIQVRHHPMSRSSSGNSVNSAHGADYGAPTALGCTSFSNNPAVSAVVSSSRASCSSEREGSVHSFCEESSSSSSSGGSSHRSGGPGPVAGSTSGTSSVAAGGPVRAIHGLPMSKHASQEFDEGVNKRFSNGSYDGSAAQYATLRRAGRGNKQHLPLDTSAAAASDCAGGQLSTPSTATPGSPTLLMSPFSNFTSPYAHIQVGQVPAQPVTPAPLPPQKAAAHGNGPARSMSMSSAHGKRPPAPPKRTNSIKVVDLNLPRRHLSGSSSASSRGEDDSESRRLLEEEKAAALEQGPPVEFPPPAPPIEFNLDSMKAFSTESASKPSATSAILTNVGNIMGRTRAGRSPSPATPTQRNSGDVPHSPSPPPYSAVAQQHPLLPSTGAQPGEEETNNNSKVTVAPAPTPDVTRVKNAPGIAVSPGIAPRPVILPKPGSKDTGAGVRVNGERHPSGGSGGAPAIPPPIMKLSDVRVSNLAARRRATQVDDSPPTPVAGTSPASGTTTPINTVSRKGSDSNILPFANEHYGTIRPRVLSYDMTPTPGVTGQRLRMTSTGESEDEGIASNDSIYNTDTVRRAPPKPVMHVQPVLSDQPGLLSPLLSPLPPPEITSMDSLSPEPMEDSSTSKDVLADIGSMLENLGSQLDAEIAPSLAMTPPKTFSVSN